MNLLRLIPVMLWRFSKRILLRKNNVFIDANVAFNHHTKFGRYCKIHSGSDITDSMIGSFSYLGNNCILSNCEIGRFSSIASGVKVIASTHPTREFVSTSPVFHSTQKQCGITFINNTDFQEILSVSGRYVIIGNDVWIGEDVKIIGAVTVGDGAILATGSVVTKDVPPYAVVGGVPAKLIRYRFDENTISRLLKVKWWNMSMEWLKENANSFKHIDDFNKLINNSNQQLYCCDL